MRAYIAHNIDGNEELLADSEKAKSEVVAAHKLAEECISQLRKAKKENETSQAEALDLAEEKKVMAAKKENIEEEATRLR